MMPSERSVRRQETFEALLRVVASFSADDLWGSLDWDTIRQRAAEAESPLADWLARRPRRQG